VTGEVRDPTSGGPERELRIVVPRFGEGILGGVEGLTRRLAMALSARAWRVEVWTTNATSEATWESDGGEPDSDPEGVAVRRFRVALTRRPRAFHQGSRIFFRLPARARPESAWIHFQGPYVPTLVDALAVSPAMPTLFAPYLYYPTLRGLPRAPHPRLLLPAAHDEKPLRLRAVGRAIAAADGLWYSTPEERELLQAVHPVAGDRPSAVGTVGIEPMHGDAARFRSRTGIKGPMLVFGGRTTAGKGFDLLLDAYRRLRAKLRDVTLVVTGARVGIVEPGVLATGRLDSGTWADCLSAATAVVVPGGLESLSLLALEAWASGRPCLVNGLSPVLAGQAQRSGGALLFDSAKSLAGAAITLIEDPGLADRLGSEGFRYVEANHRWDEIIAGLTGLIAAARART
jgi:glycosyltransferase involved in cell wall biosynthesis